MFYGMCRTILKPATLAAAISVLFIAALLLSSAFACVQGAHEHDRNGPDGSCAACASMAAAAKLLKILSAMLAGTALAAGRLPPGALRALVSPLGYCGGVLSLVHLKIRLN